ncbi:hypothetical protein [Stutzerimonas chloritidismutans]|uniref:hypothetical protein n=1 Tax=Stutzerimonas chloritidismutans TaxID=203192 RepID=UPI0038513C57
MQQRDNESNAFNQASRLVKTSFIQRSPIVLGFLIFFAYFLETAYFPPIELFGLASLLISAFLIGSAVVICIIACFWFPGWAWSDSIFKDKSYLRAAAYKEITGDQNRRISHRFTSIFGHLCIPLAFTTSLICAYSIYIDDAWTFTISSLITVLLTSLFSAWILRKRYNLSLTFYAEQCFISFLVLLFSNLIWFLILVSLQQEWTSEIAKSAILASIITIFTISLSAIFSQLEWRIALISRIFLLSVLIIASGMIQTIPGKIVSKLGLGNYEAKSIILTRSYCEIAKNQLQKSDGCSIENPFVIWGQGDMWKIKVNLESYVINHAEHRTEKCMLINGCVLNVLIPRAAIASVIR